MSLHKTPEHAVKHQLLRVGDWVIEQAAGQISRGGITVKLEPKVMDVLNYLASRPGELVTREELERDVCKGAGGGWL